MVQDESMSSGLKILPGDVVRLRASMFDGTLQVWVRWNVATLVCVYARHACAH